MFTPTVYKYCRLHYGIVSVQRLFTMTACLDEYSLKCKNKLGRKVLNLNENDDFYSSAKHSFFLLTCCSQNREIPNNMAGKETCDIALVPRQLA